ncbi:MAG: lactonase family protein [Pirellulaceae bacterium]
MLKKNSSVHPATLGLRSAFLDRVLVGIVLWVCMATGAQECSAQSTGEVAKSTKSNSAHSSETTVFIGTYTGGKERPLASKGIYRSRFNAADGSLSAPELVAEQTNPSFLCLNPKLPVLYAVSEVEDGLVVAYAVDRDDNLTELGRASTTGSSPCNITTDAEGKLLLVANYSSGNIVAIRLDERGNLTEQRFEVQHSGSSVHPRQKGPHAHCIQVDPSGQFACAVDLGLDQVLVYKLPASDHQPSDTPQLLSTGKPLKVQSGFGPRHMTFHPDGGYAFVIHELTCQLSSCRWDATNGRLEELQTVSTLPTDWQSGYSTAEVLVHPNGQYVYGSNRGHNSIACFRFNDGELTPIQHVATEGKTPRNFRLSPDGEYLLAENQDSDSIIVFKLDPDSGILTLTENRLGVGSPVCLRFRK